MKITCYGPRGSLPSPTRKEFSTYRYGGDTSCYYVEAGPFKIILDCGSGARVLGQDLMKNGTIGEHFITLISHYHWDHIQGMPFCVPFFIPSNKFHFHGHTPPGEEPGHLKSAVERMLSQQQSTPHFPVAHESLPGTMFYDAHPRQFSETFYYYYTADEGFGYVPPGAGISYWESGEPCIKITTIPLNHPDGCLGYRIEYEGKVAVYCTDNEPLRHNNAQITKHGKNADWLLLDGQYKESQLANGSQTFGHGTPNACVAQADACRAKHLVIHHHDPDHDDDTVDDMYVAATEYASGLGFPGRVEFARTDSTWELV